MSSLTQTFSISSASYTNNKSGRPKSPPNRTIRPHRSCNMYETRAISDIWNWPMIGINLRTIQKSVSFQTSSSQRRHHERKVKKKWSDVSDFINEQIKCRWNDKCFITSSNGMQIDWVEIVSRWTFSVIYNGQRNWFSDNDIDRDQQRWYRIFFAFHIDVGFASILNGIDKIEIPYLSEAGQFFSSLHHFRES